LLLAFALLGLVVALPTDPEPFAGCRRTHQPAAAHLLNDGLPKVFFRSIDKA
jgi:hypothetical protein